MSQISLTCFVIRTVLWSQPNIIYFWQWCCLQMSRFGMKQMTHQIIHTTTAVLRFRTTVLRTKNHNQIEVFVYPNQSVDQLHHRSGIHYRPSHRRVGTDHLRTGVRRHIRIGGIWWTDRPTHPHSFHGILSMWLSWQPQSVRRRDGGGNVRCEFALFTRRW